MGKKLNNNFIKEYARMEGQCQEKFGITDGGVEEYIKRWAAARFAPNRDAVLGKLQGYQRTYINLISVPNAIRTSRELVKKDVQWVKKFSLSLKKKKDPISQYLKNARKYVRGRKIRRVLLSLFLLALVASAAVALWYFGIFKF